MSLTPDWAPNIHPLVIHFPIGLLVAAAMTDLVGILRRDRTSVRDAATLLYAAGAVCAVVAYFTGHHAGETVLLPATANVLVNEHADWAFRATWFFAFFASIRLALSFIIRVPGYTATLVSFVAGLVGLYLLFETAERGGRLVFEHGVGVRAAGLPSAEHPATSIDAVDRELVDPEAGRRGDTYVIQAGPDFEILGKNSLDEFTMATPAIARGSLVIRTASNLYRITKGGTAGE